MTRADRHKNPTAFTTDLAKQAGLKLGIDYIIGAAFPNGTLFTAKLLGDPVAITIRLIDAVGFITKLAARRWIYMAPSMNTVWTEASPAGKRAIIEHMYSHEGGTELSHLFE